MSRCTLRIINPFKQRPSFITKSLITKMSLRNESAFPQTEQHTSREIKIPMPWGHVAAKQWGDPNGKAILAVHGWQDNAGTFDTLAPLLPKDWNLVCIDLPGHGHSSFIPEGTAYSMLEYLTSLARILKFFNWDKFNYIGHSMGAALGNLYACLYPHRLERLVSIELIKPYTIAAADSKLKYVLAKSIETRLRFESETKEPPIYPLQEAIKKMSEKMGNSPTTESIFILMKRGVKFLPNDRVQFIRDRRLLLPVSAMTVLSTEQYTTLVKDKKCHYLLIKAKQGGYYEDEKVYEDILKEYKENCLSFKYVEVDGTHHVHLNNPERIVDHIKEFLK